MSEVFEERNKCLLDWTCLFVVDEPIVQSKWTNIHIFEQKTGKNMTISHRLSDSGEKVELCNRRLSQKKLCLHSYKTLKTSFFKEQSLSYNLVGTSGSAVLLPLLSP